MAVAQENGSSGAIAQQVQKVRNGFNSGKLRSIAYRKEQLKTFRQMIVDNKDKLSAALMKDLRKSEMEFTLMEFGPLIEEIDYTLGMIDSWTSPQRVPVDVFNLPAKAMLVPEPFGVALVVGCWNYPVLLTFQPIVSALAAGNAVVVKSGSEECSPEFARVAKELVMKYMDNDICQFVTGDLAVLEEVLRERYDVMFATGSTGLGRMIAQAAVQHLTPVILELGGKSPVYVTKCTDSEIAAKRIVWAAFVNAGQTCVRPDHIFVDSEIADAFIAAVGRATKEFFGQDPSKSDDYGRIACARSHQRVKAMLATDAKYILWGGECTDEENYVAPTLLDFGSDSQAYHGAATMQEEIFGPILPLLRVSSVDDVLASINSREKPLSMYVFTMDSKIQDRFVNETSSGALVFNDCITHLNNNHLPFGGVGGSGKGSYHGRHLKPVMIRPTAGDIWARYPPYTPDKKRFLNMVMRHFPNWVSAFLNAVVNPINYFFASLFSRRG